MIHPIPQYISVIEIIEFVILLLIAIIANGLSAFAGGGAGLLQLPILLFLGLPFGVALTTHKIATVALGIGSSTRYWKEKVVEIPFAIFIIAFGLPGVIIGATVILKVNDNLATTLLGILTLGSGSILFTKNNSVRTIAQLTKTLWVTLLVAASFLLLALLMVP